MAQELLDAPRESLLFVSCRAELTENNMQDLTGKEWDPMRWNGDMWEDPDEAGDNEPLNSESSLLAQWQLPVSLQWCQTSHLFRGDEPCTV